MGWILVVLCVCFCSGCGYALGRRSLSSKGTSEYKEVKVVTKNAPLSKMELIKELVDDVIEAQNELRDFWESGDMKSPGAVSQDFLDRLEVVEHHYNLAYEKLLTAISKEIE